MKGEKVSTFGKRIDGQNKGGDEASKLPLHINQKCKNEFLLAKLCLFFCFPSGAAVSSASRS